MTTVKRKLTETEVDKKLSMLSGWTPNSKSTSLTKTIETPSFVSGLSLVAKIAVHAEVMNHHPVIELSVNHIKIKLTTDDAKGLTVKDFDLAKRIDALGQ